MLWTFGKTKKEQRIGSSSKLTNQTAVSIIVSACVSCYLRYTCFFLFSVISLFISACYPCLIWLSLFLSFDLVIFVAGYLLMFLEWMSGLLIVAGLGPIRWDSTSTDLFIGSSVLFMPFCLHSYFTCIVLQRQSFSQLSFRVFFKLYIAMSFAYPYCSPCLYLL